MATLEESYNGRLGFEPVSSVPAPWANTSPREARRGFSSSPPPKGVFPFLITYANDDPSTGILVSYMKTGPSRFEMPLGNYNGESCGFPVK